MRAAFATARPWLPALAATSPSLARSPTASTLLSAPRSLKEPVRCRHSPFSDTGPRASSPRSSETIMGVRTVAPAIARSARSRSASEISCAAVRLTATDGIGWRP